MAASPPLFLRFSYDPALVRELLETGARCVAARDRGWRSLLPIGGGLAAGALMVGAAAVLPAAAGVEIDLLGVLAGAGTGALLLSVIHALAQRATARILAASAAYREPVEMELRREGILMRTDLAETALRWSAVDEVVDLRRGLGLVTGAAVLPLPDAALPEGMDREGLRRLIALWRGEGAP